MLTIVRTFNTNRHRSGRAEWRAEFAVSRVPMGKWPRRVILLHCWMVKQSHPSRYMARGYLARALAVMRATVALDESIDVGLRGGLARSNHAAGTWFCTG